MIKGSLGVTLDIFCNLEKCTSCMVACSKQALHSVVRNAAGDTRGEEARYYSELRNARSVARVHCVSWRLLRGGQCRHSRAPELSTVSPNFWKSCC